MRYKFVYNRKNKLLDDGTALLQLRISENYVTKYISMDIYLKPKQWDDKRQRIVAHNNQVALNMELVRVEGIVVEGKGINKVVALVKNGSGDDFIKWVQNEIPHCGLKESSKKKHRTLVKLLQEDWTTIPFAELDYNMLVQIKRNFEGKYNKVSGGKIGVNYMGSLMATIRRYVNEAIRLGLMNDNPFDKFTISKIQKDKVWLSVEEIEHIYSVDLSDKRGMVEERRDAFIFACYTGLRYIDLKKLEHKMIIDNVITLIPEKTERFLNKVSLNLDKLYWGRALLILDKYKYRKGPIFRINGYTDAFNDLCDKHIGWHTARHSFAMNLLNKGLRLEAVQKLMGHKNISSTMIYARMLDKTIDDELDKLF